ncbi:hypothetical protein PLESTB_001161600 [Pleodorina starrii]|uniref:JmjC domain-containing protein n=1 Tax=Pleodorina starrii TaxID=330485 RepID=A0A9W6BSG5_9CHLO|nr:hypothetical protein PLESTM_000237900 [Pleodorina starrii]GLC56902.1 hypothetical protein PLESTB_001161600 [Pleodorina starrii]GLC64739.1 hypothetical protein PLESTF_000202300 [Pleodorina starrii]
MIESAAHFFRRLRDATAQAHLGDDSVSAERARRNDLIARLDSLGGPPAAAPSAAAAPATPNGTAAAPNGAAATASPPSESQPPPPPLPPPSAEELNAADLDGGPVAAPLRLPPLMPPAWLHLNNLQLYYLRNQPLEQIAQQLLQRALAPAAAAAAAAGKRQPRGSPSAPAAPQARQQSPAAPWAAVLSLAAASADTFSDLLERRLRSILTSRVHALVGCFDTAQQLYDWTSMAALPPEVRQAGVFVVINTSEAAMRAQVSLLQDKLLAEPVLSTAAPVTRQDFLAKKSIWDNEPRFMQLRDIMRACTAGGGDAGGASAQLYDMLPPSGPSRQRVDAAVAAALAAAGLPPGFALPRPLLDAAVAAASRSLMLQAPRGGSGGGAAAAAAAAAAGRPAPFTGAQTPYSVTVMGSHNSYLYGELRKRLRPLDVALSGGDPDAPPELVPLGFRPGPVVRDGRLMPHIGYGGWNAESQLALNALGSLSQAQFRAAARSAAEAVTSTAAASTAAAAAEAELPPLMNGLNAPVLVLSGGMASTPIHIEDLALPALNSNVGPSCKVWDVARLDRVGREPLISAVLGGDGGAAAGGGGAERLFRLRSKQDFRDLLELAHGAGWADGDVITVVQQPGTRVVTTPGYVWHNTVSAGAGIALSTNWMELPTQPEGAWRAHFDAVLDEMSDFARRVEYDAQKMGWMAGALQLLDGSLGSDVTASLSDEAAGQLRALQTKITAASERQARNKRRR